MISIIICSRKKSIPEDLARNIKETIGIEYEIVVIDNSKNSFSICEAYNIGAAQARYEILCFIHDDILFDSKGWGKTLIGHLNILEIGLLGVAGSQYKSKYLSGWGGSPRTMRANVKEIHTDNSERVLYYNANDVNLDDVVCIDGIFMATRKSVWNEFKFDSNTFKGFHAYDIDFSLQIFQKYRVCVCFDILIIHYAEASFDSNWYLNAGLLHKKWDHLLPLSFLPLTKQEIKDEDWYVNKTYCTSSISSSSRSQAFQFFRNCFKIKPFKLNNSILLFRILCGKRFSRFYSKFVYHLKNSI